MSPVIRSAFFWLLTAIFLITSPVFIFFLMGYRYSIERGVFVYTGSISVSSNPASGIDIRVDGEPVSAKANQMNRSFHIEGIKPGQHTLSVSAPGFTSWRKNISVHSGLSTEFWNVLLAREQYGRSNTPFPEGSLDFFSSPDGIDFLIPIENNGEFTLLLFSSDTGTSRQIFSSLQFTIDQSSPDIRPEWSTENESIILMPLLSRETGQPHAFLIDTDTMETTDLKDILPEEARETIRSIHWSPNEYALLALSGTKLFQIALAPPFAIRTISDTAGAYNTLGSSAIVLEHGTGILSEIPLKNPDNRRQITTAAPEDSVGNSTASFSVIPYDKTRIVLLNAKNGDLFLYNKGESKEWFSRLPGEVRGTQFSDDGKKLLYWTDWEIFTVFTRKWEVQPMRKEGDRLDIGRFSEKISSVQWAKDYEHALFLVNHDIRVTELDDRGGRNTATVISLPAVPKRVSVFGNQNKIFSLFNENGDAARPTLSSITFPEPTSLFGFGR